MATQVWRERAATYRPRSCFTLHGTPKRRYPTKAEAVRAAARIEEAQTVEMNAYRCWCCGAFHIGRRPEWMA